MFQIGSQEILLILVITLILAPDKIKTVIGFFSRLQKKINEISSELPEMKQQKDLKKNEDRD